MARPADPNARSALVAAAREQFREHGIQRARIEDITAACGLSKGAFYLHFESKEALFTELVLQFEQQLDALFARRTSAENAFFSKSGPFRSRDFADRSARLAELEAFQTQHDLETLELMWAMRDVIHVLINGCQGTAFDGVIWHAIDREKQRVVEAADRLKRFGVIRDDIPSDVVAMMLMGAWVLTMRQMVSQPEKPDFATIVTHLNKLIGEGLSPAQVRRAPKPGTRKPSPAARRRPVGRRPLRKTP